MPNRMKPQVVCEGTRGSEKARQKKAGRTEKKMHSESWEWKLPLSKQLFMATWVVVGNTKRCRQRLRKTNLENVLENDYLEN